MKKILILLVVVAIILGGVFLLFYKPTPAAAPIDNNKQVQQPPAFSVLDEKDFFEATAMQNYSVGQVEFKVYPSENMPAPEGWFEVYQGGNKVFASQPNYKVSGLLSFKFGENTYVVVKDYSGGAHCCDMDYLFRINKAREVKLLKTFDMGNTTISKDSLLLKSGNLYLVLTDDRFQYFHVPFAYSYFFPQYFRLDGDAITLANNDFTDVIIKTAQDCKANIATAPAQPNEDGRYWLNDIVCYITNFTLAGRQAEAVAGFDGFFNKFFPSGTGKDAFGEVIKRDTLKQEIIDTLKNDRFK